MADEREETRYGQHAQRRTHHLGVRSLANEREETWYGPHAQRRTHHTTRKEIMSN